MADMLKEWQTSELQRASSLPLRCPSCLADFPEDTIRCPACSQNIGGYFPIVFSVLRIGAVASAGAGLAWFLYFRH